MPLATNTSYPLFKSFVSSSKRAHAFYSFSSQLWVQNDALIFILCEDFRNDPTKRKARLISDWFLEAKIPDNLDEGGFVTELNTQGHSKAVFKATSRMNEQIDLIGKTFKDKVKNEGGGVSGVFNAIKIKMGNTSPTPDLFDNMIEIAIANLIGGVAGEFEGLHGSGGAFNPNGTYKTNGVFKEKLPTLRKHLKTAGFKTDQLGTH